MSGKGGLDCSVELVPVDAVGVSQWDKQVWDVNSNVGQGDKIRVPFFNHTVGSA